MPTDTQVDQLKGKHLLERIDKTDNNIQQSMKIYRNRSCQLSPFVILLSTYATPLVDKQRSIVNSLNPI